MKEGVKTSRIDDSHLEVCPDNVWFANMFKLRMFSFEEAVEAHRETHHPTMYNNPNGPLHAYIELDMSTDKKVSTDFLHCYVKIKFNANNFFFSDKIL